MKKILISWYGVTDFRASIGAEPSNGPVLGALSADNYDMICLLGWTDDHKVCAAETPDDICTLGLDERQMLASYLNTKEGHRHFLSWLASHLQERAISTKIIFSEVHLQHLNDTEGIYAAATSAIKQMCSEHRDADLTFYLSPGTPVMAFVWAFAALGFPGIPKRLIASPVATRSPEVIPLPNEWMALHERRLSAADCSGEFDVVYHLFGEQRMPSLLGIRQFNAHRHVFINSDRYPADAMKQFIGEADFAQVAVDPYDPNATRSAILCDAEASDAIKIGINMTGGTKLMYAGALDASRTLAAVPFYFDKGSDRVRYLDNYEQEPIKGVDTVDDFIKMNSSDLLITNSGAVGDDDSIANQERIELTRAMWQVRKEASYTYKRLAQYIDQQLPFDDICSSNGNFKASLTSSGAAEITINKRKYVFDCWPDVARYLAGGWFEEWTYRKLLHLKKAGVIKDIRLNMRISLKQTAQIPGFGALDFGANDYQEFDVILTDGLRLYIIECKAGKITSDHITKLDSITALFGGVEGRAILCSCFPANDETVKKRIEEISKKNMRHVFGNKCGDDLISLIKGGWFRA